MGHEESFSIFLSIIFNQGYQEITQDTTLPRWDISLRSAHEMSRWDMKSDSPYFPL